MSLIKGENVLLLEYITVLDAFVVYGCAKDCSLEVSSDMIETTVKGSGKFATFKPAKISFTGSLSGLVSIGESNLLSLADLRAKQLNGDLLSLRFQRTAQNGDLYNESADFYIKSSSDSSPDDNLNTFDVSFQGTGEPTQDFTPVEILANVKRFEYTGTGAETLMTAFTLPGGGALSLAGKSVLGFEKDGIGFSKMTSGTPVDKEFKFNSGAGTIEIAIPFEPGEEAFGYYR